MRQGRSAVLWSDLFFQAGCGVLMQKPSLARGGAMFVGEVFSYRSPGPGPHQARVRPPNQGAAHVPFGLRAKKCASTPGTRATRGIFVPRFTALGLFSPAPCPRLRPPLPVELVARPASGRASPLALQSLRNANKALGIRPKRRTPVFAPCHFRQVVQTRLAWSIAYSGRSVTVISGATNLWVRVPTVSTWVFSL